VPILYLSLHIDAQDPASIAKADESQMVIVLAVDDGDDKIPGRHRPHQITDLTRMIRNLKILASPHRSPIPHFGSQSL